MKLEMTVFEVGGKEALLTVLGGIFGTGSLAFILLFSSVLRLGPSSIPIGLLASGLLTVGSFFYLRKGRL